MSFFLRVRPGVVLNSGGFIYLVSSPVQLSVFLRRRVFLGVFVQFRSAGRFLEIGWLLAEMASGDWLAGVSWFRVNGPLSFYRE